MDQKDLKSSFFRSSLLELGHISRRLSPHVTSYSKKSFSTLSITRKIRQDLLARENLNNEITTSDIARAFLITNHTGMISLSIAKQKKSRRCCTRINYMTTSPLANYLTHICIYIGGYLLKGITPNSVLKTHGPRCSSCGSLPFITSCSFLR